MRQTFSIGLLVAIIALSIFALLRFQQEKRGELLFEAYFSPQPVMGYSTQRSLTPAATAPELSLLRQGIAYHQQEDYAFALASLRAYLEGHPLTETAEPYLLAATAAIATGRYAEGLELLEQIPPEAQAFHLAAAWHTALLKLREENFAAATVLLQQVAAQRGDGQYPVGELLRQVAEPS